MKLEIIDNAFKNLNNYIDFTNKVCVLSDSNVAKIYLSYFNEYNNVYPFIINSGEDSKSIDNYYNIIKFLLDNEFSRTDYIIALGGGVVGDLGGFIASTYKRGIKLISIPTTLLSMIDSSIGGKNGINILETKNAIGTFYLPELNVISLNTLTTVPKREIASGMMEALKASLIGDEELYLEIKNNNIDSINYNNIIGRAIKVKENIVNIDFKEEGVRKYLNLGHTIGHALEKMDLGLLHGECVALGMIPFVSRKLDIINIIHNYIDFSFLKNKEINTDKILEIIKNDKKWINGKLHFIYCDEIGKIDYLFLNESEIKERIEEIIHEISIW